MNKLLIVVSLVLLGGCANLQTMSSGQVGCPPESIIISDDKVNLFGARTWTAECNDKKYFCSLLSSQYSAQVSCSPEKK